MKKQVEQLLTQKLRLDFEKAPKIRENEIIKYNDKIKIFNAKI